MFRKIIASGLVVAATLTAVPTVLGALRSESAFAAPFTRGGVITHGWSSPQAVDATHLRIGVPVEQALTVVNAGSLPANYELNARIGGDHGFASHLWIIVTRRSDGATVFTGPVTGLRAAPLGRFNEHARETYRLRITLMPGGTAENALQGRDASVGFGWVATEA